MHFVAQNGRAPGGFGSHLKLIFSSFLAYFILTSIYDIDL